MEDIAPRLLEELQQAFAEKLDAGDEIRRLLKAIRDGTGTYIEAGDYAWEVGNALAEVFGERLSSAVLPDGRMYFNIADRVIRPLLEQDHALVADAAKTVQQHLNDAAGIGLKAQEAPLNKDRINKIIDRVSNAEVFDDAAWLLADPVRTFSQSIVDATLKANVDFQGKAGLSPKIHRKATGKCCEWCRSLAGVYRYPDTPEDVFRRHNNCRCTVEYDGGDAKKFQNVWTKEWTTAEERDKIEKRKAISFESESRHQIRAMANGPRRGRMTVVSDEEQQEIYSYADELSIPRNVLSFNTGSYTSFDDDLCLINIRGDIFPSEFAANPDSILSAKCALAHEYYGHFLHHTQFSAGDWRDEFQASYRAALDAPGLTPKERAMLMIDAFDRAHEADVPVRYNDLARRIIYGIE